MSLQVSYPEPPFSKNFRVNKKTAHAIRVSGLFLFTLPVILAVRQSHRHGDYGWALAWAFHGNPFIGEPR